ncbi:MAG: 2-C-methyl-D-erythritol 4-phosphate cytidylyltransferase [Cytophagales bacterium]|nr:2-C-methyl-D-erythritol 4-phosphate cytidylyltransferase [Cytophagales bacterium]MCA6368457.1 2-C-methyl-D-erythritol 4-phosphate cytidylyltransferase [Cytophagales bacterium]MCA6371777.1 2-C-methyl-D-erythritol 4-phosphate cytidylyltransferase [Cytophagales bacterium]MCA6376428.1 2-C-methyl-D-erythritol 4-phosphate cytidylyltransferase [Cytophagales bacterium]MCA6384976.1 2-C-methyl-D-erythritol 4-phosphate cytidylyltransferase [Cytophagales bacterium]
MRTTETALIVAGGKGTRIKSVLPKQFIELNGKPVLLHTLEAFIRYSPSIRIVLVLPEDDFEIWRSICEKFEFNYPVTLQKGGETRFQSVKNGLQNITEGLVAIHDGVRPLVSEDIIGASFRLAAIHKCAIAAVRLKESIRMTDQDNTKAVDRSRFRLIQTPQTFDVSLIKKAYEQKEEISFTDDASVAERAGNIISLFEGSYENIKITTQEDLIVAKALMEGRG